jgi:hypothetical protein
LFGISLVRAFRYVKPQVATDARSQLPLVHR